MMKPPMKPGDYHVYVNGRDNTEKVWDSNGKLCNTFSVFPHGIGGPDQTVNSGDTVEQLYLLGAPIWTRDDEPVEAVKRPYGWVFIPMDDYEGRLTSLGRAGLGAHGGGRLVDHWAARQQLVLTRGCVRHHNEDAKWLAQLVEKARKTGNRVWMSVDQPGGGGQV